MTGILTAGRKAFGCAQVVEEAPPFALGQPEVHDEKAGRRLADGPLRLRGVEGHADAHAVADELAHEHAEQGRVVIGQDHVRAAVRGPEHLEEPVGGGRGRDLEPERAPLADFALHADLAPVLVHDGLAYGEAEPRPARVARVAGLDLAEALADVRTM